MLRKTHERWQEQGELRTAVSKKTLATWAIFAVLAITAVIAYPKYGKGIGYFMLLVFPLIYIAVGLSATLTSKWWTIMLVVSILLFGYVYLDSQSTVKGFMLPFICYVFVSVAIGFNSKAAAKHFKFLKHK